MGAFHSRNARRNKKRSLELIACMHVFASSAREQNKATARQRPDHRILHQVWKLANTVGPAVGVADSEGVSAFTTSHKHRPFYTNRQASLGARVVPQFSLSRKSARAECCQLGILSRPSHHFAVKLPTEPWHYRPKSFTSEPVCANPIQNSPARQSDKILPPLCGAYNISMLKGCVLLLDSRILQKPKSSSLSQTGNICLGCCER